MSCVKLSGNCFFYPDSEKVNVIVLYYTQWSICKGLAPFPFDNILSLVAFTMSINLIHIF